MEERVQSIMELEGATEQEARVLYHLDEAYDAWLEITRAEDDSEPTETWDKVGSLIGDQIGRAATVLAPFVVHHKALATLIYSRIHHREHGWDSRE